METDRRIKKVGRYHSALFVLPILSLLFYGWLKAPELNERPDNPQRLAPLHMRGEILDRAGNPLANTVDRVRRYPEKETVGSLVGYQLRGKNHTGLESSLQMELSPPLPPATLTAALEADQSLKDGERERLRGPNITLTLDLELQRALYETLEPKPGAIVVADRRGSILAAVSSPSFDSNRVREQWQELRDHPQKPFIERVGGGLYPVTLAQNQAIIQGPTEKHPWFQKDVFANYPEASSALLLEDRLLVTPLMLLQYSYTLAELSPIPSPTLFPQRHAPMDQALNLDTSLQGQQEDQLQVFRLQGPAFKKSPPFLAQIGHLDKKLFYVLVVEEIEEEEPSSLERRVWSVLNTYQSPAPASRGVETSKL